MYIYVNAYIYVCMCVSRYMHTYINMMMWRRFYGVATVSRIDKITGLFCRIASLL